MTSPPSTEPTPPARGRPREFDSDAVICTVIELFWDRGYEATGVADIAAATGLSKSSLYNAFGSKEALFARALDRYGCDRGAGLNAQLEQGTAGLDDLRSVLAMMRIEITQDVEQRGCLMVTSTTELGRLDPDVTRITANYRDGIRSAVRQCVERAATAGEIDRETIDTCVEVVIGFIHGIAVLVRGGASETEIEAQFEAVGATVDSWQRTD